jgi:hypothetical protein
MAKFQSATGQSQTIFLPGTGQVIRLRNDEVYETDDKEEIEALKANDAVTETRKARESSKK